MKLLKMFTFVLLGLLAGVGSSQAQQLKVYFASLKAQTSPASTGSGQVKLTWVDITGSPLEVALAKELNWAAYSPLANWTGTAAYSSLQTIGQIDNGIEVDGAKAYDGPSATAQVLGGTMCAMDGVETRTLMGDQIYMTSYVYYHAEVVPDAGSYLSGWTFTDPAVSRIDTAMGPKEYDQVWDDVLGEYKYVLNEQNSGPFRSPCFKVLPDTTNNAPFVENEGAPYSYTIGLFAKAQEVANTPAKVNNIYAIFNKYLLSNPQATSGHTNAGVGNEATLSVSIDVEGDITQFKENYADFVFPSLQGQTFYEDEYGTWSWNLASLPYAVGATKMRAEVTVTFRTKTADTGTRNATITIRMAHADPSQASTLDIPLSVDVRPAASADATLYEGKTPTATSGPLSDMIAAANNTDKIVVLNRDYPAALNVNANVTIDLNGYDINDAVTVSGGEVTFTYSKYGGSASSLTVNDGKAILNGGTFGSLTIGANGTVEQNGATITGAASNAGSLTTTEGTINGGLTSSKTLVMNGGTFKGATAVIVSGGTANINRGDINGTTVGLKVTGGTAIVKKLAAITSDGSYSAQRTGGTLNVECGKFGKPLNGTINFTSGYFKNQNYGVPTEGKTEMLISAGVEYNEGYRYFLGTNESASANGVGVCRIGTTSYSKLEDALAYANNNPSEELVIFMTNNYVLPAGYYTLPEKATLVVPMSDSQSKDINMTAPRVTFNDVQKSTPYEEPTEFRRLTFASGVNMDVFGDIELTCSQYASNEAYTSQPTGKYGRLVMEEGSHMTLQSGSELRAWGFMTGKGETDARRGSIVREIFQLGDWKGAFTSVKIVGMIGPEQGTLYNIVGNDGDKKIFPVTQYFIQNVESPVKYHPGAVLSTSAAVSEGLSAELSVSMAATDIAIVGVDGAHQAIFLMDNEADADNTWVRKWYDAENDIQVYDINSGAHIGSMVLDMGEWNVPFGNKIYSVPIRLNSAKFDLPLTSNFKIHLLSGTLDFKQNTSLLPGAEVEVDKESTVSVAMDQTEKNTYKAWVDGGKVGDAPVSYTGALYVYDFDSWDSYAYGTDENGSYAANTKTVRYAPSWKGRPTKRDEQTKPASAAINVRGTFMTATGFVYTSASGANIFSSNEDAGTFIFNENASEAENPRKVYQVKVSGTGTIGRNTSYDEIDFYPARLKNGNGTYENTDEAVKDLAYCYQNNKWSTMIQDGCFMKENRGGNDIYYAKPAEYVALANGKTENADHTYSDAAGAGRLFILMDDCQWWEVENVDNLYHCIHPDNDTYYYWDNDVEEWAEKTFTITWKNWDGSIIQTEDAYGTLVDEYIVTYGTMAEFLGTNPTREADIDYTYNFTGWSPALAPVTSDVTYTATYKAQPRMYTIIFQNEGGTEIERQFLTHNAVPVCENMPTKVGHILTWTPAISPVIGDQTYVAKWLEEPPTEWDVTFVNNANGELQATEKVAINAHPTYNGSTPDKENANHTPYTSDEYTYTFWGWSAVIDGVAQQFAAGTELPCPTAPTTYTAVYTETPQTYTITFKDGETVLFSKDDYHYGDTPECPEDLLPADESDAQYTYTYAWDPQIQTVMGNQTYQWTKSAPTTNRYTVTLTSNLSGVCTFTGAGTFDYGTEITNVAVSYNDTKYTFDGWSDGETDADHPSFTLIGNITLTANFTPISLNDKTIAENETWKVDPDTEVKDLVLTSDGLTSGQIENVSNLTIRGKAIFEILDVPANTWYAFGLPWKVSTTNGLSYNGGQLTLTENCYIIEFDAAAYAAGDGSNNYWKYVDAGATLQPGVFYMIYLRYPASKLDFTKASTAPLANNSITVYYENAVSSPLQSGWNAIANPTLQYATLGLGVVKGQIYIPGEDRYEGVTLATTPLIVGQPLFVQISGSTRTVNADVNNKFNAPRRSVKAFTEYEVRIAPENGDYTDRLYVKASEDKEDRYVIGQDLSKISTATKVAQMWVNRYDAKLCANVVEPIDNQTVFPMGIYAPKDGQYTISTVTPAVDNEDLFVTINGQPVWNLAQGAYNIDLKAGTTNEYGLLLVYHPVPEISTGCESLEVADKASVRKVLINGQVFIIRDGAVYTIFGQKAQ